MITLYLHINLKYIYFLNCISIGSLAILNKKLKAFDGIQSPKRIYDKATAENEDIERANQLNTRNNINDDLSPEEIIKI